MFSESFLSIAMAIFRKDHSIHNTKSIFHSCMVIGYSPDPPEFEITRSVGCGLEVATWTFNLFNNRVLNWFALLFLRLSASSISQSAFVWNYLTDRILNNELVTLPPNNIQYNLLTNFRTFFLLHLFHWHFWNTISVSRMFNINTKYSSIRCIWVLCLRMPGKLW